MTLDRWKLSSKTLQASGSFSKVLSNEYDDTALIALKTDGTVVGLTRTSAGATTGEHELLPGKYTDIALQRRTAILLDANGGMHWLTFESSFTGSTYPTSGLVGWGDNRGKWMDRTTTDGFPNTITDIKKVSIGEAPQRVKTYGTQPGKPIQTLAFITGSGNIETWYSEGLSSESYPSSTSWRKQTTLAGSYKNVQTEYNLLYDGGVSLHIAALDSNGKIHIWTNYREVTLASQIEPYVSISYSGPVESHVTDGKTGGYIAAINQQGAIALLTAANISNVQAQSSNIHVSAVDYVNYIYPGTSSEPTGGDMPENGTMYAVEGTPATTTYTLSFNLGDAPGTPPEKQPITEGMTTTKPDDPTWAGHTFQGWYTAKDGGSEFTFGQLLTADTTVYAHWAEDNGTTIACAPQTGADPAASIWQSSAILLSLMSIGLAFLIVRMRRQLVRRM